MNTWIGKRLYYVCGSEVSSAQVVRETPSRLYVIGNALANRDGHGGLYVDRPNSGLVEGETDDPYRDGHKAWPRYKGWIATSRDVAIAKSIASHQRDIASMRDKIAELEECVAALSAAMSSETVTP